MKRNKYPTTKTKVNGSEVGLKNFPSPKNYAQEQYIQSLNESSITIGEGPAGSGKTFLVVAVALSKLLSGEVAKIVLTRPVVEADEKLGFLPGTLEEKLDPYLRPLYDAIEDNVGPMAAKKLLESGKIEIAPLAYMRGRTFNDCFVILDEAQNSTPKQMKMFLTRIGYDSIYCIDGDTTQSDLVPNRDTHPSMFENGLQYAVRKLAGGKSRFVNLVRFTNKDVVRSEQAKEIVALLDAPDERRTAIDTKAKSFEKTQPAIFSAEALA